jgi:hypothetical protein
MKIRLIAVLAVAALSVMALAVPAAAHQGVGVFTGTATVTPLGLPIIDGNGETGTWELHTTVTGTQSGALDAKGNLGPALGVLGAACGSSSGSDGAGTFGHDSLSNLGWVATAGGTLPVTGNWNTTGTVVAVVQAQGGAACASNSADSFTVVGVAALL